MIRALSEIAGKPTNRRAALNHQKAEMAMSAPVRVRTRVKRLRNANSSGSAPRSSTQRINIAAATGQRAARRTTASPDEARNRSGARSDRIRRSSPSLASKSRSRKV
jgi:hypothetical protein